MQVNPQSISKSFQMKHKQRLLKFVLNKEGLFLFSPMNKE